MTVLCVPYSIDCGQVEPHLGWLIWDHEIRMKLYELRQAEIEIKFHGSRQAEIAMKLYVPRHAEWYRG